MNRERNRQAARAFSRYRNDPDRSRRRSWSAAAPRPGKLDLRDPLGEHGAHAALFHVTRGAETSRAAR